MTCCKNNIFSRFDYQIRCRNSDVSTFSKNWSILKENHRSEIWNMIVKGQISNQTIYVYECAILIIWSCRAVDRRLRCIFSKAKYYIFTRGLSVGLYLLCNNSIVQLQIVKWITINSPNPWHIRLHICSVSDQVCHLILFL